MPTPLSVETSRPLRLAVAGVALSLLASLGPAVASAAPGGTDARASTTATGQVVSATAVTSTANRNPSANRKKAKKRHARPGKYKGHFYTNKGKRLEPFTFRITKNGKKLKKFRANIEVICSYYPPTVELHPFAYPAVKVNKRHKFKKVWKPNKDSKVTLKGRFKGNKLVSGRINYLVGICVRTGDLKAKRVGK